MTLGWVRVTSDTWLGKGNILDTWPGKGKVSDTWPGKGNLNYILVIWLGKTQCKVNYQN